MKIEFIPSSLRVEQSIKKPEPTKNFIPQWYKNIKIDQNASFDEFGSLTNLNVKHCSPFLDSITHGYTQSTWCDINIKNNGNGNIIYNSSISDIFPQIIGHREKIISNDFSQWYENVEFFWTCQWIPKMPKGWSIMIVPPLNHFELPFTTSSGIIDSDTFFHAPSGQLPFYIKKGFDGIIPLGTPMFQMIPIKRENWKSKTIKFDENKMIKRKSEYAGFFIKAYKDLFWKKKIFE